MKAWLETPKGEKIEVHGNCAMGRHPENTLILPGQLVSKRHAMIHLQGQGDYCVVDLGSTNGTFVNSGRISKPALLKDGDKVSVGENTLIFRKETQPNPEESREASSDTMVAPEVDEEHWLLVADVEGFTPLSQQLPGPKLAQKVGKWIANCNSVLERNGATINKYLGDGFLAYWPSVEAPVAQVANAIKLLIELQRKELANEIPLPFRIVVHHGKVLISRSLSEGRDEMLGEDMNFTFRMEKIAAGLKEHCLLSVSAAEKLRSFGQAETRGSHALKGFPGEHEFFAYNC